jgi:hypothetical protein
MSYSGIVQGIEVADWVADKAGNVMHSKVIGLGYMKEGKLIAGFAFDGWNGKNVNAHQRQDETAPRGLWFAAADYVFNKCGCKRVTGTVPASNEKALRLNRHIGYEIEATLKECAPDGGDLHVMVLWRDKCRMLEWKR